MESDTAVAEAATANGDAGISLRSFAKLVERNPMVISRAVKSGRIPPAAVARDAHGDPKISDVQLALRAFYANTDLSTAPNAVKERLGGEPSTAAAQAASGSASKAAGGERPEPSRPPAPAVGPAKPADKPRTAGEQAAAAMAADDASPDYGQLTLSEASAQEKRWKAKTAELDYRERAGELVSAADVAARTANVFTLCRTKLLGMPTKAKQLMPHLTLQDVARLEEIVRESLEELSAGAALGNAAAG